MAHLLHLESFDSGDTTEINAHPEYLRGLADGKECGLSQAEAEQTKCWNEICTILTDTLFTYAEARQSVITDFRTIAEASVGQLLPAAATVGLVTAINENIGAALVEAAESKLQLTVHPDVIDQVKKAVLDTYPDQISITPSKRDAPLIAWLSTDDREICINFDDAMTAITAAFDCLTEPTQRKIDHG